MTATEQLQAAIATPIHPEHGPILLVNTATFPGQDEEQQNQINDFTRIIAEAIEHTLGERGYTIVRTADIATAPKAGSHTLGRLICRACGGALLPGVIIDTNGTITITPADMHAINLDCGSRHGNA